MERPSGWVYVLKFKVSDIIVFTNSQFQSNYHSVVRLVLDEDYKMHFN